MLAITITPTPAMRIEIESPQTLAALLQLASPALPIGAFSYSQGLEAAIDAGLVTDATGAERWIAETMALGLARAEAPLWLRQHRAWCAGALDAVADANAWFVATRETAELRAETLQMGWSLNRLAQDLEWGGADWSARRSALDAMARADGVALPTASALACAAQGGGELAGLTAIVYAWLENQVAAAIKAVPLGQSAGQRILVALRPALAATIDEARRRAAAEPPDYDTYAPQFAILSARHETQYSRLFRS